MRRWLSLAVLTGAVLLLAIDSTVLYLAVPSLTRDLDPTATQVLWIGDIYSLAIAGLLVTMGNVADRIGRKKLLLIGSAAFGIASIVAAFAPSAEVLIAARLVLGIAGATLMPSTLSLIRNIFTDPTERTRAIAIWSAAAASGIALGPIVGGVLLEHFWWGSVFLINIPVMLVILVAGAILLPESKNPDSGRFDLLSSALSMLAIVPFVALIKRVAGGTFDLFAAALVIASVVGAWLFIRRQRRSSHPMIEVDLFKNGAFSGAVVVNFISVFAMSGALFFFSQYLQLARELGPLEAGLAQLPAALASMAAITVVGMLLRRLGRGRAIALALTIGAVGLLLVGTLEQAESVLWVVFALVPLGFGIGISETLSVDAVVSAVPSEKAGAASSISETAYELGGALGIAILGSLMTVLYRAQLVLPAGSEGSEAARDSLARAMAELDASSPALAAAHDAFVAAMQTTTFVAAGVMAVGALLAWRLIPNSRATVDAHG
ncbi:MFS transporter [Microbacterium sorbitolivorans]|uniref:MFS transporter n=1 Tax=Microbacterium sorbitolivorans TaxID=1867410 RepID=A0A367Y5R1_9MICO|nr:MFS transporter [Microbacterium sorbitolivorans]RCK61204.1 MFS transporter [Microbacterium sorbitolivorans]GGF34115.1 MFS transporter [Microbacterium sorbitolivorans]